nr:MAG TPA: glycoprotein [Caudoviricetes sp.]
MLLTVTFLLTFACCRVILQSEKQIYRKVE